MRNKMAASTSAKFLKKRKKLSLEEKWRVADGSEGNSQWQITTEFGIGKALRKEIPGFARDSRTAFCSSVMDIAT